MEEADDQDETQDQDEATFQGEQADDQDETQDQDEATFQGEQADDDQDETQDRSDSDTLPYPFKEEVGGLYLNNPSFFSDSIIYNPHKREVTIRKKIGDYLSPNSVTISVKDYHDIILQKKINDYFRSKSYGFLREEKNTKKKRASLLPPFQVPGKWFENIFGGNTIEIVPKGSISVQLGLLYNHVDNPKITEANRGTLNLDFDQKIQFNATAKIGTKFKFDIGQDTKAMFDFQNLLKINYSGEEDDIVKNLNIGDVSMTVNNSLIRGAQSLFGVKSVLQFGDWTISSVFSQQRSNSEKIDTQGGDVVNKFEISTDKYENNKHFFLSQYFYHNYDDFLSEIPFISSGITIVDIEVWITNKSSTANSKQDTRNIIAISDLGENNSSSKEILPENGINADLNPENMSRDVRDFSKASSLLLSKGLRQDLDFIQLENAKKLNSNEYTFNKELGYISLNRKLNDDQVLAVAFQYNYNGKVYQVGELSHQGINNSENLVVKLLKSKIIDVNHPTWKLMMKNIYSIGSAKINKEDFKLNILYKDDQIGIPVNYIKDGNIKRVPLLKVFKLDVVNKAYKSVSDGYFDFLEGITIDSKNGRIIFPVAEPFGEYLEQKINDVSSEKYVFKQLYNTTKSEAEQNMKYNRFLISGEYKSKFSDGGIPLGAINVQKGSVKVSSMGRTLTEGVDYTVDYKMGLVKIINQDIIQSNSPVSINVEKNSMFNFQTKTFMGINLGYQFSDNLLLEATVMNLSERYSGQKVSYNQELIKNTLTGFNLKYNKELPWLTSFVNSITPSETNTPSSISIKNEFAYFFPGTNDNSGDSAYIDDFESSISNINIKTANQWSLASTPINFPKGREMGKTNQDNRAKLSFYTIDPLFYANISSTPPNIRNDKSFISTHKTRQVNSTELFPNKDISTGSINLISTFDIAFFPDERGPYNTNAKAIDDNGKLKKPEERWGGIMRPFKTSNFEQSNIEYLQFWLLDTFSQDMGADESGEIYFHIGNVSEDILKDKRKSVENGLPALGGDQGTINTGVAKVPSVQILSYSFDNDDSSRRNQDVGLDGFSDEEEKNIDIYRDFLNNIPSSARSKFIDDPAGDNFEFFRGSHHDENNSGIIERYKNFSGTEGNSPTLGLSKESYMTSSKVYPDTEDIDRNKTLDELESYAQYKVGIKANMSIGNHKYLVDKKVTTVTMPDRSVQKSTWYQFKIPLQNPSEKIGGFSDFRSVRYVRMIFKKFRKPIVFRFAKMDFMRGEWRRFKKDLKDEDSDMIINSDYTSFDVRAINLEENENRTPIPYTLPPGVQREKQHDNTRVIRQNEQSILLDICNIKEGDSRAIYKGMNMDLRRYSRIKMFIHAEAVSADKFLKDDELKFFIRLGSDQTSNYYEYEIPLKITPSGERDPNYIWPKDNELDLETEILTRAKISRNEAIVSNKHPSYSKAYRSFKGNNTITVKGNPSLADVKVIMMGIRNPENSNNGDKCVEVWLNELRLTDINKQGGWGSNASVKLNLADLADLYLDGSIVTSNFGALNEKNVDLNNHGIKKYNFTTSLNTGKLLPEDWKIKLPIYYSIAETFKTPMYNPTKNDLKLENSIPEKENRDSILSLIQDYQKVTSISFTDVKKGRSEESLSFPWDIENFSVSYHRNHMFKRKIDLEYYNEIENKGKITYNYNVPDLSFRPFYYIPYMDDYVKVLSDINLRLLPSSLSLETDFHKEYISEKNRSLGNEHLLFEPIYSKNFRMNWKGFLTHKITDNLNVKYEALNQAIVHEYEETEINPQTGILYTDNEKSDYMWNNILSFGEPQKYKHGFELNYNPSISKIPFLQWLSANYSLNTTYSWDTYPVIKLQDKLGNTIQNSISHQINGKLTMNTLYDSFDFIINSSDRLLNNAESLGFWQSIADYIIYALTGVKDLNLSINVTQGTLLPGFLPSTGFFGIGNHKGVSAPDWKFLLGFQDDIREMLVSDNLLTTYTKFNTPSKNTFVRKINYMVDIVPFPKLRIKLSADQVSSNDRGSILRNIGTEADPIFAKQSYTEKGNFSNSIISIGSSMTNSKDIFNKFLENRKIIANELAAEHYRSNSYPSINGYPSGFSSNSEKVILLSFLHTYLDEDINNPSLSFFRDIPIPNWRATYSGLRDIVWVKDYLRTFNISHAYESAYSINQYQNNPLYDESNPNKLNKNNDFIQPINVLNIALNERFNPLIGIDIKTKNDISLKIEMKKSRALVLSLKSYMLNEVSSKELIFGGGYTIRNLAFDVKTKKRFLKFKSDLKIKFNLSIRENYTTMRNINNNYEDITGGSIIYGFTSSVDYSLTDRLKLELYFDYNANSYIVSTAYPTIMSRFGIKAIYILDN
ncbi:SprA protein [Ichthyobacterium seriolicida]|uniref:SprA protein n=1 Tax=Ichthyobacterium seriolicida TaxID=242600 RepID=A0A1J1E9V3_9FLAO|nr:SprA protein [Ichthyobacterium seriolicida]